MDEFMAEFEGDYNESSHGDDEGTMTQVCLRLPGFKIYTGMAWNRVGTAMMKVEKRRRGEISENLVKCALCCLRALQPWGFALAGEEKGLQP